MPKTYCIICGKEKDGIEIKNDRVLWTMRWIKRNIAKNEKRNRLVVCKVCYPIYKKKRDRYTSKQLLYLVVGVIFTVLGMAINLSIQTFLVCVLVVVCLYLLSLVNYTPALSIEEVRKDGGEKRKQ